MIWIINHFCTGVSTAFTGLFHLFLSFTPDNLLRRPLRNDHLSQYLYCAAFPVSLPS